MILFMLVANLKNQDINKNLGQNVVQTLVRSTHNSCPNLTVDKFFSSLPLATYPLDKDISVAGTKR